MVIDLIKQMMELILHLDKYLDILIQNFGFWTYAILFLIIFLETGIVLTPFLPGDSLIFTAGAFASRGLMNVHFLFFILCLAAILGDTINYWIGHLIGPKIFNQKKIRFIKKEHLEKTHNFYEKHGGKTIILARFVPIIRTFAPFVAGIGAMTYWRFLLYNVIGAIAWVGLFVYGGYFFGSTSFIKNNFTLFLVTIIIVSFVPILWELLKKQNWSKYNPIKRKQK